jgi:hypothetical protein
MKLLQPESLGAFLFLGRDTGRSVHRERDESCKVRDEPHTANDSQLQTSRRKKLYQNVWRRGGTRGY